MCFVQKNENENQLADRIAQAQMKVSTSSDRGRGVFSCKFSLRLRQDLKSLYPASIWGKYKRDFKASDRSAVMFHIIFVLSWIHCLFSFLHCSFLLRGLTMYLHLIVSVSQSMLIRALSTKTIRKVGRYGRIPNNDLILVLICSISKCWANWCDAFEQNTKGHLCSLARREQARSRLPREVFGDLHCTGTEPCLSMSTPDWGTNSCIQQRWACVGTP